jgi:hypothetical protein
MELILEEFPRIFRNKQQTFIPLPGSDILCSFFLLDYFYSVLSCEIPQGLNIGKMFIIHYEPDSGTSLVASETIVLPFGRDYVERWSLFIVKRTTGPKVGSALLQSHEVTYHLLYPGGVKDLLYRFLRNHYYSSTFV